MDRRIQKTRNLIFDAFESLLRKKTYSQITVQNIIDEANIGRSTFYSHFETKDELLNSICDDIFNHIFSEQFSKEETHDFSLQNNKTELTNFLTHILYHLKDEKKNCKGLLSCEMFWEYFNTYFSKCIMKYLKETSKSEKTNIPDELKYLQLSHTFIELSKWWISNGLKESPEIIENYYEIMVSSII